MKGPLVAGQAESIRFDEEGVNQHQRKKRDWAFIFWFLFQVLVPIAAIILWGPLSVPGMTFEATALISTLSMLVGWGFALKACWHWAFAKGYGWEHAMFGLLDWVGLLILYCLPDRSGVPDPVTPRGKARREQIKNELVDRL